MRPPVLPSGNHQRARGQTRADGAASMRPPVLPSGKHALVEPEQARRARCFNEAAGFTRRKRLNVGRVVPSRIDRFNDAAGFTRRKPLLTGVRTGGNGEIVASSQIGHVWASMRPPVLPSGNVLTRWPTTPTGRRFNEAAGFTQRKPLSPRFDGIVQRQASMRPPVLPSGNMDPQLGFGW